jgi:hypothetical protein
MNTDRHGSGADDWTLYQKLDWVISHWCERKALRPLRLLLPAYPGIPVHTDQFYILLEGLRDVKGLCRTELTTDELKYVIAAINEIEDALKKQSAI